MSKKESSKKNVFGLVSKLGNLIKRRGYSSSNTENTDASSGENDVPKKNYNIHISEDDQGDDIDVGDEEEEEEEEEEEKEKEKEKVKEKFTEDLELLRKEELILGQSYELYNLLGGDERKALEGIKTEDDKKIEKKNVKRNNEKKMKKIKNVPKNKII